MQQSKKRKKSRFLFLKKKREIRILENWLKTPKSCPKLTSATK